MAHTHTNTHIAFINIDYNIISDTCRYYIEQHAIIDMSSVNLSGNSYN
jgi:hypothetical protein